MIDNTKNKGEGLTIFFLSCMFLLYPISPLINNITSINFVEILTVFIIIVGIRYGLISRFVFYNSHIFVPIIAFLIITFLSTLIFNYSTKNIFFNFRLIIYFLVFCTVGGCNLDEKNIYVFLRNFLYVFTFICVASLLDYFSIIKFSHFNENSLILNDQLEDSGYAISDLSSIYNNRSQLSVFNLFGFGIVYAFITAGKKINFFHIFSILIIIFSIFITFSRGAIVSVVLFLFFYNIKRINFRIFSFGILVFLLFYQFEFLNPYYDVFLSRFNSVMNLDLSEGDKWRYVSFVETLDKLIYYPFGLGFGNFEAAYFDGDIRNTHNTFVTLLRAGGFIGFFTLLFSFLVNLKKIKFLIKIKSLKPIYCVIFLLLIYSFTHDILGTLLLYIVLGIVFSFTIKYNLK